MKLIFSMFFLFFFFVSVKSQEIVEILNNNSYKLDNGKIVRLADLYIPDKNESNKNLIVYEHQINDFLHNYLIKNSYSVTYVGKNADSTYSVILNKNGFMKTIDVGLRLLSEGYAINMNQQNSLYENAEDEARNEGKGIWATISKEDIENIKGNVVDSKKIINDSEEKIPTAQRFNIQNKNLKPSFILFPIAMLGAALSVESFLDAKDISNDIDDLKKDFPKGNYESMESQKNRKTIFGVVYGITALAATLIAIDGFDFVIQNNSYELNYKYSLK